MANTNKFRNLINKFTVSKYSKLFAIAPFVIILVAVIVIVSIGATNGGDYTDAVGIGIDFEGGSVIKVELGQEAIDHYDEHRERIESTIEGFGVTVNYVQQERGNRVENTSISFRYKNISNDDAEIEELNEKIRDAVDQLYPDLKDNVKYESIGATAAHDLLSKAGIALAVSVTLILIYIIIRFTLMSGFAAIIALIHDVVIMFALTVICRVQINSSYVAAMITIIAYSINNTIIIFDRCREEIKPLKKSGVKNIDYVGIGDLAVKETLTRSLYTTFTTMVTVILLAILGSDTIREFCVPIILGLIAGLYSSVCLATPLWSAMSISFDKTKAKYAKRNEVTYDKKDDDEEEEIAESSVADTADIKPTTTVDSVDRQTVEKPQNKQKSNAIHKYSKKNLKFKDKK